MAFETMHSIAKRKKGKVRSMAIKLDMSKAYDRVEWAYLGSMMQKMGFEEKWISLIMMCLTTASFSVLINGEPRGTITPSRGLRQGDPISPYLFLLCAEGLTALLRKKEAVGLIRGVAVSRLAPSIAHLFFVDDCIIFCRATMEECRQVALVRKSMKRSRGKIWIGKKPRYFSVRTQRKIFRICEGYLRSPDCQTIWKVLRITPNGWKGKEKGF